MEVMRAASPFADAWALARAGVVTSGATAIATVDPLHRLMDASFTERTWLYEYSRIGEDIPGNLHQKQIEALKNPARHRWLFWGNQVGKTTVGAIDIALKALGRHPRQLTGEIGMPPRTAWASALTWELWENILLPELLTWIPRDRIISAPEPYRKSTKRDIVIRADNGKSSRITGKAAEQGAAKYQSARVNDIWLDEEHPEAVWDEMQPRLLRYGGNTLATMTPLLGFTWVHGRVYEPIQTGQIPRERHWFSHAGLTDNPAIEAEAIAELTEELKHNPAQLTARLYGMFTRPHGAVLPWDPEKHLTEETFTPADVSPDGRRLSWWLKGQFYGALDLGKWRFAFVFGIADHESNFTIVDEVFSQNEDMDTRAERIDELLKRWRVPDIMIPADCADPDGIKELNAALERRGSKYYVFAIEGELKKRLAGVARVESLLNRGALKVRRGMGADHSWRLGMNASKPGKPVMGSRWMWEAANWQYPKTEDGKVQKDDPDDATADGADMMDATRYIAMKFFPAEAPKPPKKTLTQAERLKKEFEDFDRMERDHDEPTERDRFGSVLRQ